MIDTLHVNIPVFNISPNNKLLIMPSVYEATSKMKLNDRDLFYDSEGSIYTGARAYYNDEIIQVSILPKYNLREIEGKEMKTYYDKVDKYYNLGYRYKFKASNLQPENYMQFQCSLPKVYSSLTQNKKANLKDLNPEQEKQSLLHIFNHLKKIGIEGDIESALITRLDSFSNIKTDLNFSSYKSIFQLLQMSRKEKFEYKGETFLFRNKQSQICIYDKKVDLKFKAGIDLKNSLMRIENRLITKKKVLNRFGSNKLTHIFNDYNSLRRDYKETIMRNVFKYNTTQFQQLGISFADQVFQYFKSSGSRYWINDLLYFWARQSIKKYLTVETFLAVAKNYVKKSRYYEIVQKFEKNKMIEKRFFSDPDSNILDLYNEIKYKFVEQFKKVA